MVDATIQTVLLRILGKVCYTDDEYAEENGDVEIDQYADEVDVPDDVDYN